MSRSDKVKAATSQGQSKPLGRKLKKDRMIEHAEPSGLDRQPKRQRTMKAANQEQPSSTTEDIGAKENGISEGLLNGGKQAELLVKQSHRFRSKEKILLLTARGISSRSISSLWEAASPELPDKPMSSLSPGHAASA